MNPDEDNPQARISSEQNWPLQSLKPHIREFMTKEAQAISSLKDSPEVQKIKADLVDLAGSYQKPQEFMKKFSKMDSALQYHIVKTMFFPGSKEVNNLGYRAEEYVVEFHDKPVTEEGTLSKPDYFVIDGSKLVANFDDRARRSFEPELPNGIGRNDLKSILLGDELNPKTIDTKLYIAFQAQMLDISDKQYMDNMFTEGNEVDKGLKWQEYSAKKSPLDQIKANAIKIVRQAEASGLRLDKTRDEVFDILWSGYTIVPLDEWVAPSDQIH